MPYVPIKTYPERLQPSEAIVNKIILRKCATVTEAIATARSYDWGTIYSGKLDVAGTIKSQQPPKRIRDLSPQEEPNSDGHPSASGFKDACSNPPRKPNALSARYCTKGSKFGLLTFLRRERLIDLGRTN